jgi:hypothetical protein
VIGAGIREPADWRQYFMACRSAFFADAVPMVAWMRRRGHDWSSAAEMSAAMFVPVAALIVCYRLQAVSADSVCPIACAAMIPAMLVAMLNRHDEYTGHQPAESSRI